MLQVLRAVFGRQLGGIRRRARSPLSRPPRGNEAAELFELAQRLQRLQSVAAPDGLRRTALSRALAGQMASDRRPRLVFFPSARGLALAAGRLAASVVAGTVLGYGAYAASAASLPDSPLYQVKLLVEDARVAIAPADQRSQIYVEQATRRIEETDALIQDGRISDAERSASDAARRIESARAAAGDVPAVEVQRAIGTTEDQYRSVSRVLADRGGSSPIVSPPEARAAAAPPPPIAAEVETPPQGDAAPPENSVGAPLTGPGFTTIDQAGPVAGPQVGATGEGPGRVSAPPSDFSAIGSSGASATGAGRAGTGAAASAPTPASRPATVVPSPTRTPVPAAVPAATQPAAPVSGFTPIPSSRNSGR